MKKIFILTTLIGLMFWNCSKMESENKDLKQSLQQSIEKVNTALGEISSSEAYKFLTVNELSKKSEEGFNDSITLDLVAGIYDYHPDFGHHRNFYIPYRLFKKTGTSDHMVVNLPEKLIFHPRYLQKCNPADTALKNNFRIDASDYHFYYTWLNQFDYNLSAGLQLDSADIGSMDITASAGTGTGRNYSSKFNFVEGYSIDVSMQSGDTATSSFALTEEDEILMKESVVFIWKDHHKSERQYTLTIGNIDIKRSTGIDSIQVYLDDVLQETAGAKIIDTIDNNGSICYHRDILLTFDDGTTEKLSTLIGPARATLKTLVPSMHSMYFAKNVVDYISMGIYYHSRWDDDDDD